MSERIKAFIAADEVSREALAQALPADGEIDIVGLLDGPGETWRAIDDPVAEVLVVACSGYAERALALIQEASVSKASRPVVVLCEDAPSTFVRRAFESGADDVVPLPETHAAVAFTLQKAVARRRRATTAAGSPLAPLVSVLGPKGGSGKTVVATNLAVNLAERGKRVALIDLDLQFGDVGLTLGLTPQKTIFDLARSSGTLDSEKAEAYFEHHESGLRVLLAPTRPDQAVAVGQDFLRELYTALRKSHDLVVVDTGPGFSPETIGSVDSSSDVVVVGMLDALSLKSTKLGLEALELMGYDPARIKLVLNRADTRIGITAADVEVVLGRTPDVMIPSDRDIPRFLSESRPIVTARGQSEAARALKALAATYATDRILTAASRQRPLRRLLRKAA